MYAGAFVGGQVAAPRSETRWHRRSTCRTCASVRAAYRFLPNGTGLVYLPRAQSRDFWLLDLATRNQRQLTRLSDQGKLQTFDITPDGKQIVFDRLRDNSDIVLIDSCKRSSRTARVCELCGFCVNRRPARKDDRKPQGRLAARPCWDMPVPRLARISLWCGMALAADVRRSSRWSSTRLRERDSCSR